MTHHRPHAPQHRRVPRTELDLVRSGPHPTPGAVIGQPVVSGTTILVAGRSISAPAGRRPLDQQATKAGAFG